MNVKCWKIDVLDGRPLTTALGKIYEGIADKPKIGERFNLSGNKGWLSTSPVIEIVSDNVFKTLNSVYYWKIIK